MDDLLDLERFSGHLDNETSGMLLENMVGLCQMELRSHEQHSTTACTFATVFCTKVINAACPGVADNKHETLLPALTTLFTVSVYL